MLCNHAACLFSGIGEHLCFIDILVCLGCFLFFFKTVPKPRTKIVTAICHFLAVCLAWSLGAA